jgi:hypothetical protein
METNIYQAMFPFIMITARVDAIPFARLYALITRFKGRLVEEVLRLLYLPAI